MDTTAKEIDANPMPGHLILEGDTEKLARRIMQAQQEFLKRRASERVGECKKRLKSWESKYKIILNELSERFYHLKASELEIESESQYTLLEQRIVQRIRRKCFKKLFLFFGSMFGAAYYLPIYISTPYALIYIITVIIYTMRKLIKEDSSELVDSIAFFVIKFKRARLSKKIKKLGR